MEQIRNFGSDGQGAAEFTLRRKQGNGKVWFFVPGSLRESSFDLRLKNWSAKERDQKAFVPRMNITILSLK
jgi:hypothetical protein